MKRTKAREDSWSRSLGDDECWSSGDEALSSRFSRQQRLAGGGGDAQDDGAADEEDWSDLWSSRDDVWSSAVDIGAVDEPASLKFVETPFTIAKRTGASWAKAKGADRRQAKPVTTAAAASRPAAPSASALPSTPSTAVNPARPKPAPTSAFASAPSSRAPSPAPAQPPVKPVEPARTIPSSPITPKKPQHQIISPDRTSFGQARTPSSTKFRPAVPSTPNSAVLPPSLQDESRIPPAPPAPPIVVELDDDDDETDTSSTVNSNLSNGVAATSETAPTSPLPPSPSPPQAPHFAIRPDSAVSTCSVPELGAGRSKKAPVKPFVSPVRAKPPSAPSTRTSGSNCSAEGVLGTSKTGSSSLSTPRIAAPSPPVLAAPSRRSSPSLSVLSRPLPYHLSQAQQPVQPPSQPAPLVHPSASIPSTSTPRPKPSSAKKLDRFRHRPSFSMPPPPSSRSTVAGSFPASKPSFDSLTAARTDTSSATTSSSRFTLPGLTPSSVKRGFKPAESLSSFRQRVAGASAPLRQLDDEGPKRETVVLGSSLRSVRPADAASSSSSSFGRRKRPRISGVPVLAPRLTASDADEEHEETAEERLRRVYRSLDN
ncbi:hypothetical protein JCM6882_001606 [Rhodosporidiobolus microsporus]